MQVKRFNVPKGPHRRTVSALRLIRRRLLQSATLTLLVVVPQQRVMGQIWDPVCGQAAGDVNHPEVDFLSTDGSVWCGYGTLVGSDPYTQSYHYTFFAVSGAWQMTGTFDLPWAGMLAAPDGPWPAINIQSDGGPTPFYIDDPSDIPPPDGGISGGGTVYGLVEPDFFIPGTSQWIHLSAYIKKEVA